LENKEFEKAKVFDIAGVTEYVPKSVVTTTIMKKTTGNISAVALDSGELASGKFSPFDVFVQNIDGSAEIVIDGSSFLLTSGQSIIIPAHSRNSIKAPVRCKVLLTVIKSGYE
jgi:quercetin dioxygenase-like cupin family protein